LKAPKSWFPPKLGPGNAGKKYNCAGAREELAYAEQDKWFNLFGRNLSTAFQIDAFTLNVSTHAHRHALGGGEEAAAND
jgi:hypothetical protein